MNVPDVMVYLMTGFLDSGKTGFLKFTLKQDYFQIDGKTLLILCEDGEDEYDAMEMLRYGVVIDRLEDREELTEEYLAELDQRLSSLIELSLNITECGRSVILKI